MSRLAIASAMMMLAVVNAMAADEAVESTPPTAAGQIDELSQEDIDAELERIEQALGDDSEVTEFTPVKPLPADLPVALPSDI
jgi:hypothetical protein